MGGMKTLIFESYGNNEIRVGYNDLPSRLRSGKDGEAERQAENRGHRLDKTRDDYLRDNNYIQYKDVNGKTYRGNTVEGFSEVALTQQKLDIICKSQQEDKAARRTPRHSYGQPVRRTVFTRRARHRLLEAGELFSREYASTHCGYFVTLTLPGSTDAAYDAISRWSGYLANRVLQVVRRNVPEALWFYVWELQKRGALHMHLFLGVPRSVETANLFRGLRAVWYGALSSIGDNEGVDMFRHREGDYCTASVHWQFDCQEVNKSPAAYISKYVSKGANAPKGNEELDSGKYPYYPARWWGMSREMRRVVDENRFRYCMDAMTDEEIIAEIDCMDAMLTNKETVCKYEYFCEIGSSRDSGGSIGSSFRRIYYFPSETFREWDAMFRAAVGRIANKVARHLRSWKYHSDIYQGTPIGAL